MFLVNRSRAEIAYADHQCDIFTHFLKASHEDSVKLIIRYLQWTKDKGIDISPRKTLQVDCHVGADFSGLCNVEHGQDPTCAKSRTGYLILFINFPLIWKSNLQTQIALSTMEAKYIALSESIRELIGVFELL